MSLIAECFRRIVQRPSTNELKGYKVTNVDRSRKFGVACRNLKELKRKACVKLNITNDPADVHVYLLDGSLVDEDYFRTLEPQTTFILQRPGEKVLSDADLFYHTLRGVNVDFLIAGDKVAQFLTENLKKKIALLHNALNSDDTKTVCSRREEHPEWFEGLETNYTTKEAYMHRRCQDRIRGYLYKTIEQIKCSDVYANDARARQRLLQSIAFFKMQLKQDHYFGYYFDRSRALAERCEDTVDESSTSTNTTCYDHCPCKLSHLDSDTNFRLFGGISCVDCDNDTDVVDGKGQKKKGDTDVSREVLSCPFKALPRTRRQEVAICDRKGEFRCEGVWSANECSYGSRHKINPYRSKEELLLFSTWNLDHKIERSRMLIPRLLNLSLGETLTDEDVYDVYEDLFTVKNLKLVHIVCHDKGSHTVERDVV